MNISILIGRIATDLELKQTANGKSYLGFTLAVNRPKKEDGTQDADFIRCKAFGKTAELINQYQHKGNRLGIVGTIQTGSYQNQQGQTVYTTDILVNRCEFLEVKKEQQQNAQQPQNQAQQATNYQNVSNYNQQPQTMPQQAQNSFYNVGQQAYDQMFSSDDMLNISSDDLPF